MFTKKLLDFKDAGALSSLVSDYLSRSEKLNPFFEHFPDEKGFAALLNNQPYQEFDRASLSTILMDQANTVSNTSASSIANIESLKNKNSYTVTTGHQLCLFTGPLYFIYKIISTINLAEQLRKKFPGKEFIPVYWMASEDHDFEEVNHFYALGKEIVWKSKQDGAVGAFKTEELQLLFPAIKDLFGRSERAGFLTELFENAYLKNKNLGDATRFLVNALFGEYGLVIADGDDKRFKSQFKEIFKKDIFQNVPFALVDNSVKMLEKLGYASQVHPRTINCFYLEEGKRLRIERSGDFFNLVGTKRQFTPKELEAIIEERPESISPNVTLRPVYQQIILPNLAYLGGPGELAYWLEFKEMFNHLNVQFPVLMPRNFVTVVDKVTSRKMNKLQFEARDFYKSEQELIHELQKKKNALFDLDEEKKSISDLYSSILKRVSLVDKTLSGSVSAELQKSINGFERLAKKTNRAIRRRYETEIEQIHGIREKLFPKNTPQERYENFSGFYLQYGDAFFKDVKQGTDPFIFDQYLFIEE